MKPFSECCGIIDKDVSGYINYIDFSNPRFPPTRGPRVRVTGFQCSGLRKCPLSEEARESKCPAYLDVLGT